MKKILLALILCFSLLANTGCSFLLVGALLTNVSERETDPNQYGKFHKTVKVPDYYPESISNYTVKDYCYVIEKDSTLCYEIFIDVTMPKEDFDTMLSKIMANSRDKTVKDAFHSGDYKEIIFRDEYKFMFNEESGWVEKAEIEKVIYNKNEPRFIFVLLYVEQDSTYDLQSVEYFNKLRIDPFDYSSRKANEV